MKINKKQGPIVMTGDAYKKLYGRRAYWWARVRGFLSRFRPDRRETGVRRRYPR